MKVTVDLKCTAAEARAFLGLPDVTEPNQLYVEKMTNLMQGLSSVEQMQEYAKQMAPMGQAGLKLFQQMMEKGAGTAFSNLTNRGRKRDVDE